MGNYSVTLTSSTPAGSNTKVKAAIIKVKSPPTATITSTGPTNFCAGSSVLLNANVSATSTYQWQKDNVNIIGATDTSLVASAAGSYSVIVTNKFGCTRKSSGKLVTTPLSATITANGPTTFCNGGSVVFSASPTGAAFTYQWKKNDVIIAGATGANYTATTAGKYKALVTQGTLCSDHSNMKTVSITCRDYFSDDDEDLVSIYPNPSAEGFTIDAAENVYGELFIEVSDITGRSVEPSKSLYADESYTFGGNLSEGVYLLKITNHDKKQVMRLVKTK